MRAIWDFLAHTEVLKAVTQAAHKRILKDDPQPRWDDIAWGFRLPNVQYWRL